MVAGVEVGVAVFEVVVLIVVEGVVDVEVVEDFNSGGMDLNDAAWRLLLGQPLFAHGLIISQQPWKEGDISAHVYH